MEGFKIVRKDGSTYRGFRWPMPTDGNPVEVVASDVNESNTKACPSRPGDGLCVALTAVGASSGGIGLADAVGLWLQYDDADVLGREDDKLRVRRVVVTDVFDPLAMIRSGMCPNLREANLRGADLREANLRGADLREANLWGANLVRAKMPEGWGSK